MKTKAAPSIETQPEEQDEAILGVFEEMFPAQVIQELYRETKRIYYQRLLSPLLILWGFIFQRLNADHSCDAAWSYLSSESTQERFGHQKQRPQPPSESTSAYCQARQRLPLAVARQVLRRTADQIDERVGEDGHWHALRVNLIDGSTLQLSATTELLEHYGTNRNQYRRGHWPLMRIVAGFDFFSGAATGVAEGPYAQSEHPLAAALIRELGSGWLHVGDRYLGAYHVLQAVVAAGSQANIRLNDRSAKRLGGSNLQSGCDLDVTWKMARYDKVEPDLPTPDIAGRLIYIRLEKAGFRPIDLYLFTTLSDRETYPAADLIALYGSRWNVELDLRHVKTTLKMEQLDGKSVDIVRKELYLGLAAYNLLRGLMTKAALLSNHLPCQLSLAQCCRRMMDAGRSLSPNASPQEIERVLTRLLMRMGRCVLLKRKRERFEPRAIWGRAQVYPIITNSRDETRQAQLKLLRSKS